MAKISNSYLYNVIDLSTHIVQTKKINERIHSIGKKVFSYLHRNQTAFAAAIWSYLFIEVGMVASQITMGEEYIGDLSRCQKVLCDHWHRDIETHNQFSPNVEFQCNSSIQKKNSLLPYIFSTCMADLCGYMKNIGENFYSCIPMFHRDELYTNSSISGENATQPTELTFELWNSLCPKKKFRHADILKEAAYMNQCLKKLCNYYFLFKINLDKSVIDWCQNTNINNLYEVLTHLSHVVRESQKESEDSHKWMKGNVIATLVAALAGVVVSVVSIIGTIATCRASRAASTAAQNIPSLASGLKDVINSAAQTTKALIEASSLPGDVIIPRDTLSVLSEISESLSYYSAQNFPIESPQLNVIEPNIEVIQEPIQIWGA